MSELTAFFEARRGRLHGFRFRDFADFKSCPPGGVASALDQVLGEGDGEASEFSLVKAYGDQLRRICKPVAGSVRVSVGGDELAADEFEIDATTGRVTLATAPGEGEPVTAGFLFDTPVRFDADRIEVTLESFGAGRMNAMPLIELRV